MTSGEPRYVNQSVKFFIFKFKSIWKLDISQENWLKSHFLVTETNTEQLITDLQFIDST